MRLSQNSEYYRTVLPAVLSEDDVAAAVEFSESHTPEDLADRAQQNTRTFEYNGRRFQMVVDKPKHADDNAAVGTFTEFGTGIPPRFINKSLMTRDMVNEGATLILQPTADANAQYMNFSRHEQYQIFRGNMAPIIGSYCRCF